ncbi:MAG: GTP-binding protein [Promethearchaeia archaeon]
MRSTHRCKFKMKIVVTGSHSAGKSRLIHNLSDGNCINIERRGTTIAMDHATVEISDIPVFLFGTPGLLRFRTMRKILSSGADGIIFVVDSVDSEADARAKLFFREIAFFLPGVPCIVAANKQDLEEARRVDELRESMKFLAGLPVIPCSARTGKNVENALRTLLYLSMMQWSEIFAKFAEYSSADDGLQGLMSDLNISREQAVGHLRRFELRKLIEVDVGDKRFVVEDSLQPLLENPVLVMQSS